MAGYNFGGLGFTFFGKDVTLGATLNKVSEGFTTVWNGLKNLAGNAARMTGRITSSFKGLASRGKGLMGAVTGALDNMANRAMNPNIDNALSSTAAQFRKTWGEITVGMNMNSKVASRWKSALSSAAYSLNTDWGEAAKNWAAFRRQGLKLEEVLGTKGMTATARQLIRVTSVLGIEGKQLALIYSGLTKGFGFTTKRVRGLMDMVFSLGKQFNFGKEAVQGMPGILDVLNKELAGMFKGAGPKDIEKFTFSIMKLAAGFKEGLGASAEDALELSKNLFTTLAKERKGLERMFIGMGDGFSDIAKALSEKGGVQKAFKMIMADPAKFMEALRKMSADAEKRGGSMGASFLRLKTSITKALGANVSFLATGKDSWGKASKAMAKMNEMIANQSKYLGAMGKAAKKNYGTGLTKGDAYKRMLDRFNIRLKKLSEPELNKWIKMQRKGFDSLMKRLGGKNGLANKSGPIGALTRRLLLMQRVGLSGLFVGLGNLGPMIEMVVTKMGPMLTALAAMGVSFAFLGKLLMPGGIILAGLMLFHKGIREKVLSGLQKLWEYAKEKLPAMWPQIKEGLYLAWNKAIAAMNWLMDVVSPMMLRLADAIAGVDWGGLTMKLLSYMGKFFRGVFEAIFGGKEATKGVTAGVDKSTDTAASKFAAAGKKLAGAIGKALKTVVVTVGSQVYKFFTDWSMGFEKGVAQKGKLIGGIFITMMFFGSTRRLMLRGLMWIASTMYSTLAGMLTKMYAWAAGMAAQWGIAFWPVVAAIAVIAALGVAFYALTGQMGKTAKLIAKIILHPFLMLWDLIQPVIKAIKALWKGDVLGFFKYAGIAMLKAITFPFRYLGGVVENVVNLVSHLWGKLRDSLSVRGKGILDAIAGPFKVMWGVIKPLIDAVKKLAGGDFVGFFKSMGRFLLEALLFPFKMTWNGIKLFYTLIVEGWKSLYASLGSTGRGIMDAITWPFRMLWKAASWTVGAVQTAFQGLWVGLKWVANAIWQVISFPWRMLYKVVSGVVSAVLAVWRYMGDSLTTLAEGIWAMISWPFRKLWQLATAAWNGIKAVWGVASQVFSAIGNAIYSAVGWVWEKLKVVATAAWSAIKAVWSTVIGFYKKIGTAIYDGITWAFRKIKEVALAVFGAVKNAAKKVAGAITGFFSKAWGGLKSMASKAWGGIKSAASAVGDKVRGGFSAVGNGLKSFFGGATETIGVNISSITSSVDKMVAKMQADQIEASKNITRATTVSRDKQVTNQKQIKETADWLWNGMKQVGGAALNFLGMSSAQVTTQMAGHMNVTSSNAATTWTNVSSAAAQGNTNVARASASGANQSAAAYAKMRGKVGGEMVSVGQTGAKMYQKLTRAASDAAAIQIKLQMAQLEKQKKFTKQTSELQAVLGKINALRQQADKMGLKGVSVSTKDLKDRIKKQTKIERQARVKFYDWWATRMGSRAKAIRMDIFGQNVMPLVKEYMDKGMSMQQALSKGMMKFQRKMVRDRADQLTQLYAQLKTGENLYDLPREQREAFRGIFRRLQGARAQRIFKGLDLGALTGKNVELSPKIIAALKKFDPRLKVGEGSTVSGISYKKIGTKGLGKAPATGTGGVGAGARAGFRARTPERQVSAAISKDTKAAMADVSVAIAQLTQAIRTFQVNVYIQGDIGDYLSAQSKRARLIRQRANASKVRSAGSQ